MAKFPSKGRTKETHRTRVPRLYPTRSDASKNAEKFFGSIIAVSPPFSRFEEGLHTQEGVSYLCAG